MIKHYAITLIGIAVLIGIISITPVSAAGTGKIDFEGLSEGAIVSSLSCGSGITCTGDISGSVVVVAHNPQLTGDPNAAMIFDAECLPGGDAAGCSGEDDDLFFPGHGKTLIISEDLDSSDPDDADANGSFIEFDFSAFGPGGVTVNDMDVGDIELSEGGAFIEGSGVPCTGVDSGLEPNIPILPTGNNGIENVALELSGVRCLLVHLNGSGTVDNIRFTVVDQPAPGIDIEKLTNGQDADLPNDAGVPQIAAGDEVTWTYAVTNTGNVALQNVDVFDDNGTSEGIVPVRTNNGDGDGNDVLSPGEVWIYSAFDTAENLATTTSGVTTVPGCGTPSRPTYENMGKVTADPPTGAPVDDQDPSHYCNPPGEPGTIDIEKATNGQDADGANDADVPQIAVGDPITWTYAVTNTGNVPFNQSDVTVEDDTIGPVTNIVAKGNGDAVLSPGETWTYQATGFALDLGNVPAGVTTVQGCNPGGTPDQPAYQNLGVVTAPGATDQDLSHYCNPPVASPALARITGGGWRVDGSDLRSSGGFTLHCDIILSNNFQLNWGKNKWHINKFIDAAFCFDDPEFTPFPPKSPADTYIGLDVGRLNNTEGSVACFKLEDHGEKSGDPDGPDQALIRIWEVGFDPGISAEDLDDPGFDCLVSVSDPSTDSHTVLFVPESNIQGNFQFHEDQPHKKGDGR